ncbi:hypothetical protein [Verrucosispora sp. WMMD573]|uniref:hypothetical protein n=1 Tax=Verrucosispora sp. WMMD573 TaxID=3015149 RepID=UPI00248D3272|nr:hypothetical protein [Verrucosispora sp. WMMD573]WBB57208.1 hypothetical protein O7601_14715 [Verrucosispora sp. WMMD573]
MRRDRRRASDDAYQAAVSGVAAYLADEDADVHNIADAAVRDDGLAYALHLIALAATAITALAAETDRTPTEVLRLMKPGDEDLRAGHALSAADVLS